MRVIKVLKVLADGKRVSPSARGRWRLSYQRGKWTAPFKGKIMVWEHSEVGIEKAKSYIKHSVLGESELWLCEAEGVAQRRPLLAPIFRDRGLAIVSTDQHWEGGWENRLETSEQPAEGELMADRVKPLMILSQRKPQAQEAANELLDFMLRKP